MVTGRMPACTDIPLAGEDNTSVPIDEQVQNKIAPAILQVVSGNKINHNPLLPKIFIPSCKRPASISEVTYWFTGSYLQSKLYKMLYYHLDTDGNAVRKIKSEFREMISMGCAIITHYYDVMTGKIGFHDENGKWVNISQITIAKKLKVSLIRVKRFFKFLKARGFIRVIQHSKELTKGRWESNIATKIINPSFFINTLGKDAWRKIIRLKEWMTKKAKPKTKDQKENVNMLQGIFHSVGRIVEKIKRPISDPERERKMINLAYEKHQLNPLRTIAEYYKEIKYGIP